MSESILNLLPVKEEEKREFEYELLDSPEKAIELVENRTVDVFISDMHMPVMTGAELFSMIEML